MSIEPLGIEHLGLFGIGPLDFVHLAGDLGCSHIAIVLRGGGNGPDGHPPFSLLDDRRLRRTMLAAMDDRGVRLSLGDGFLVTRRFDAARAAAELDVMAELGAPRIATVSFDPERQRTFERFAALTELAADRGMETVVEFVPGMTIATIADALDAVGSVGNPSFRVLVDVMHLVRSGASAADLAALGPERIAHVQLCDARLAGGNASYFDEAISDRMVPGEGGLPLVDILAVVPADVSIGLEVPMRAAAEAGIGPYERMSRCVVAGRRLLAEVADRRPGALLGDERTERGVGDQVVEADVGPVEPP